MTDFDNLATDEQIEATCAALNANGMVATVVDTADAAKETALKLIPEGAEVFTMTSVTLDTIGLSKELNESGKYNAVRPQLETLQGREKARLGAAPEYSVSSVHAVTEDGHVLIASNTGSQLSAAVYGAAKVVFIVGAHKLVKDDVAGLARIREHVLPQENERALKAYGMGSNISKLLFINKEVQPDRIQVIIVRENLGF
jgi:hypothetical protein